MNCQKIFLSIPFVTIDSLFEYGFYLNNYSVGGSVARAKAANVSMIKFTQSI